MYQVETAVSQRGRRAAEECTEVDDLVAYEVISRWDTSQVLDEITDTGEIAALRTKVAGSSSAPASAVIRFRIGELMTEELNRRRGELEGLLISFLSQWALRCRMHPLSDRDTVMSATFLVVRGTENEFADRLRELASRLGPGQQLIWSGPTHVATAGLPLSAATRH